MWDRIALWIAHRLPRNIRRWAVIDAVAAYTVENGHVVVPEVTAMEVIGWLEPR